MDEELVAGRLSELRTKTKQLRTRRDEINLALDTEPTAPEPATLTQVADHITKIMDNGTPNQRKALVEALVAHVTVTGPDRLRANFHIPQQPQTNQETATPPAETAGGAAVRTLTTSVELRGIEPLTYSMRTSRATNCATAPRRPTGAGERC